MKKANILEVQLYPLLEKHFKDLGYEVKAEVRDCDLLAVKDQEFVAVEIKVRLNLEVIVQAAIRQKYFENVYVAVLKPDGKEFFKKKWRNTCNVLRRLELGLLLVNLKNNTVDTHFEPKAYDMTRSKRNAKVKKNRIMEEFRGRHGNYNVGGSTGKKIMTRYKEMAIHIGCCLEKHGELSPKQLRELGTDEKKTQQILYNNHYGWFEQVSKGLYQLSEVGKAEVMENKELYEFYSEKVGELSAE